MPVYGRNYSGVSRAIGWGINGGWEVLDDVLSCQREIRAGRMVRNARPKRARYTRTVNMSSIAGFRQAAITIELSPRGGGKGESIFLFCSVPLGTLPNPVD